MNFFGCLLFLVAVSFAGGSSNETVPKERLSRYCHSVTSSSKSYCMTHKNPPVCHGSSISCSSDAVLRWESSVLPQSSTAVSASSSLLSSRVTYKDRDDYCRTKLKNQGSYCKVKADSSVCHGSTRDCSVPTVAAFLLSRDAVSRTTTKSPKTKTTKTPKSTTTTKAPKTTTMSAPVSTPIAGPDPCELPNAVLLGRSPTSGNSYYTTLASVRACMLNTRISHANAIWTLHNLHFGIAESYSFTDLATNSLASVHANVCRHTVHPVEVDLVGEIVDQIANYNAILSTMSSAEVSAYLLQERPAYEFHATLLNLMNRLHDAHTLYTTPFDMFRVYAPISFGSKMGPDGNQVITLRMSFEPADPLGRLAYVYQRVYGVPLPIPSKYAGTVVTHVNGIDALEFLKSLTFGELAASYQQSEQRLNAFVFSTPLLAFSQVLSTLPNYNSMILRFADGVEAKVKYLGQFADLSSSPYYNVPNLRSTPALSTYMHTNEAFNAFMKQEGDAPGKQETLWKYAARAAASEAPNGSRFTSARRAAFWNALSRKHKALLDPVSNLRRDNLLNVPMAFDPLNSDEHVDPSFVNADVLAHIIRETLDLNSSPEDAGDIPVSAGGFVEVGGLSYLFKGDTVIVRVPSMVPEPRFTGDGDFYFFPDFVNIHAAAQSRGITRLLFDVTGNGGGYVISAYALMWYIMTDKAQICAPLRKRITPNWTLWLDSFGEGLGPLVDKWLDPKGDALADEIEPIFADSASLTTLIFDGLGFGPDVLGPITKAGALARLHATKLAILAKSTKREKANAILRYLQERNFLPSQELKDMVPSTGFAPFDAEELSKVGSGGRRFSPFLSQYKAPETRQWGSRNAKYSLPGEYRFCQDVLAHMPTMAPGYNPSYWSEIGFVSDGTCGSACALFTQGIQLSGSAVAFTYGGVANTAMDVAAFAGGNVEEYSDFWPQLALGAKIGQLVTRGESPWSKAHVNTWVASPIAFPTRAGARFNWNMMFSPAMGPDALPRQFYLVPPRRHVNMWASNAAELDKVYTEIVHNTSWRSLSAQFASTHGQCPSESS